MRTMPVNHVEDLKREKDGLDVLDDIYRYAKDGFDAITDDDFDRFKWYGLYQQKPRNGHFMMRIKIIGGQYSSKQMRTLAGICRDYARGFGDITTRQAFQFHWLTIQDVPDIFARLHAAGLTSIGACGDVTRAVTGCPVAGLDADEIFDAHPEVVQVSDYFLGNKEYSNLPRKFKISISGCSINCMYPQINCVAFVGVPHGPAGVDHEGYNLYVGGGLSTSPHFAKPVNIFATREQVLPIAIAVTEIFRDRGGRDRRTRSRLKFLMDDWGPEKFREEIASRVPFDPYPASGHALRDQHMDHHGVHSQKEPGLNFIGVTVPTGRITADQMMAIAEIADRYGKGRIGNTIHQNLVLTDISDQHVPAAVDEVRALGFSVEELAVKTDCVVCTGNEFCNLAVTETKQQMRETMEFLERNVNWDRHIKINMNGCPNSCGQHWIADIGLQGASTKIGDETVECYDFHVGGGLGEDASFVRKIARRIGQDDVKVAIANLVKAYQATREEDQSFRAWCNSQPDEELAALLGVRDVKLREEALAAVP